MTLKKIVSDVFHYPQSLKVLSEEDIAKRFNSITTDEDKIEFLLLLEDSRTITDSLYEQFRPFIKRMILEKKSPLRYFPTPIRGVNLEERVLTFQMSRLDIVAPRLWQMSHEAKELSVPGDHQILSAQEGIFLFEELRASLQSVFNNKKAPTLILDSPNYTPTGAFIFQFQIQDTHPIFRDLMRSPSTQQIVGLAPSENSPITNFGILNLDTGNRKNPRNISGTLQLSDQFGVGQGIYKQSLTRFHMTLSDETLLPYSRILDVIQNCPRFTLHDQIFKFDLSKNKMKLVPPFLSFSDKINDSQKEAIHNFLKMEAGLQYLIGPPGTGKTTTIVELLRLIRQTFPRMRVLVTAHSNKAVLELAQRYQKIAEDDRHFCLTLNKCPEELARYNTRDESCNFDVKNQTMVFTTLSISASSTVRNSGMFDFVIIDEGSQADIFSSLLALRLGSFLAKSLIVGDPCQLPPTLKSPVNTDYELGMPLITRAFRRELPSEFLRYQYRMSPKICTIASKFTYRGILEPAPEVVERRSSVPQQVQDVYSDCAMFHVEGREEEVGTSRRNEKEIQAVKTLVDLLRENGVEDKDIGVITFYSAQMSALKETLGGNNDLTINTVDSFQGGEKKYIILSCVRTTKLGFVGEQERLNVAISRAQEGLWIFGHMPTLKKHPTTRNLQGLFVVHAHVLKEPKKIHEN